LSSLVVAFPKQEVALKIKKLLGQSGYTVTAAVSSGAAALQAMAALDHSILICGPRFSDMMYSELNEYLTNDNRMLLVASAEICDSAPESVVVLGMPLQVHDLLETVRMMDESLYRLRKKQKRKPKVRTKEDQALLNQAKALLMERNKMSEDAAHRYIQQRSMENGTGLIETAQMIVALNSN